MKIDDRPTALCGTQRLITADGYDIPLDAVNRHFTNDDWNTHPHVTMTRDAPWSPRQYDSQPSEDESRYARPHRCHM